MTEEENISWIATLKSLKCSICTSRLSVAPIMKIGDDEYQCGRCKTIKPKSKDAVIRCELLERVARDLKFPCTNNGCPEILPWKDVEAHEIDCVHTMIVCPIADFGFKQHCDDKIAIKDLTNHVKRKHGRQSILYLRSDQMEQSLPLSSSVCLGLASSMEFLIYIGIDRVVIISVKPVDEDITYTLEFFDPLDDSIVTFANQSINRLGFNERKHCFRCLDKRCNFIHHPFSSVYSESEDQINGLKYTSYDIDHVQNVLSLPSDFAIGIKITLMFNENPQDS